MRFAPQNAGALLQFRLKPKTVMRDLHADDITSETSYPAAILLHDIRNLIASGQREGPLLDYKADISPKDNWPETIAAFANTLGGTPQVGEGVWRVKDVVAGLPKRVYGNGSPARLASRRNDLAAAPGRSVGTRAL